MFTFSTNTLTSLLQIIDSVFMSIQLCV